MGPDDVVAPDERLSWGKTVGLGAQHVVAMFGATFVFPLVMGLNPQLAIMMSGIATICFLLIVNGKVPSYLGTSASFVGACRGHPGPGRRPRPRSPARSSWPASCSPSSACSIHFVGFVGAAQGAAAGRHRRRRHAHRLQPRAGRRQHLLAAGPVGGAARHVVHHRLRGRLQGLRLAHRGLPRADLRLRHLVGLRQDLRPDQPSFDAGAGKVDGPLPHELRQRRRGALVRPPAARP